MGARAPICAGGADRGHGADGSFVPARSVRMSIVDRVFTRIGASDNVPESLDVHGRDDGDGCDSAHGDGALLILLDEVGAELPLIRLAIAWRRRISPCAGAAKTLFARTIRADRIGRAVERREELSRVIKETGGSVVFLRRVEPERPTAATESRSQSCGTAE